MGADPSDLAGEVVKAVEAAEELSSLETARQKRDAARRIEAVSLRLAGWTLAEIGEKLGITYQGAQDMINRSMQRAEARNAEQLRELEGDRLDAAQAAIWQQVLDGDLKAVETFIRLSARRAKLMGLDAPTEINLSMHVRQEMEAALIILERTVLGDAALSAEQRASLLSDPDQLEIEAGSG